jgi:hypothetical protein
MSFSITNFVTIKMKKIGIIADESSETRAKVILYSGLEDQSMLLIFAREDIKYIPNIHNNQRIKEEKKEVKKKKRKEHRSKKEASW